MQIFAIFASLVSGILDEFKELKKCLMYMKCLLGTVGLIITCKTFSQKAGKGLRVGGKGEGYLLVDLARAEENKRFYLGGVIVLLN